MFCGYCGTSLPDDAEFCSNCGKAAAAAGVPGKNDPLAQAEVREKKSASKKIKRAGPESGKKKSKIGKKLKIAGILVVVVVAAAVAGNSVNEKERIGEIEDAIYGLSASGYNEDEVARVYQKYDSLSDSDKRKVTNRETLLNAFQQVEALIAQRRQEAGPVEYAIGAIDYSNIYAEASTVKEAVLAYNSLDDKAKGYVESYEKLQEAYEDVKDLNMAITEENFWDLFIIEFSVGEKANYGEGTVTTRTGSTIDWYTGTITPNYDIDVYDDYATPVYIYIQSRYPSLTSECSFYMNLHQTYKGIGLVDSDTHEFKRQSATLQFDSSQGIGAYRIDVENNDASKSVWNAIGMSFDFSDAVHKMDTFDPSRVEVSDVSGRIIY